MTEDPLSMWGMLKGTSPGEDCEEKSLEPRYGSLVSAHGLVHADPFVPKQ